LLKAVAVAVPEPRSAVPAEGVLWQICRLTVVIAEEADSTMIYKVCAFQGIGKETRFRD
jgi:hypothetical protein